MADGEAAMAGELETRYRSLLAALHDWQDAAFGAVEEGRERFHRALLARADPLES